MTYDELSVFGRLRKVQRLGPWGMFEKLVHSWSMQKPSTKAQAGSDEAEHQNPETVHAIHGRSLTAREVMEKVARFFHYYCVNRHKMYVKMTWINNYLNADRSAPGPF